MSEMLSIWLARSRQRRQWPVLPRGDPWCSDHNVTQHRGHIGCTHWPQQQRGNLLVSDCPAANRKHNPLIIIYLAPMASGDRRGIWPDLGPDLRPGEAKRCLAKIGRHKKTGLVLAQAAWGWVTGSAVLIRCIKALTVPVLGPTRSPLIYIAHEDNTSVSTTQRFLKKELNWGKHIKSI